MGLDSLVNVLNIVFEIEIIIMKFTSLIYTKPKNEIDIFLFKNSNKCLMPTHNLYFDSYTTIDPGLRLSKDMKLYQKDALYIPLPSCKT